MAESDKKLLELFDKRLAAAEESLRENYEAAMSSKSTPLPTPEEGEEVSLRDVSEKLQWMIRHLEGRVSDLEARRYKGPARWWQRLDPISDPNLIAQALANGRVVCQEKESGSYVYCSWIEGGRFWRRAWEVRRAGWCLEAQKGTSVLDSELLTYIVGVKDMP